MIKSFITFYKTGLNGNNWAYDKAALTSILASAGLAPVLALTRVLSFGTPFEITDEQYALYKTATYIKIENTDDASGTTITRYARIQNFLSIYTGGYTVAYTLDDWANYVLNADEFNAHIDGFVTHANLKLATTNAVGNNIYNFDRSYGEFKDRLTVTEQNAPDLTYASLTNGRILADGFMCALIKYKQPLYLGAEVKEKTYARTVIYEKTKTINALGYYAVQIIHYDATFNRYETARISSETSSGDKTILSNIGQWRPDSDNIEQITYLPFFPTVAPQTPADPGLFLDEITDSAGAVTNYEIIYNNNLGTQIDLLKKYELYDVSGKTTEGTTSNIFSIDVGLVFSTEYTLAVGELIKNLTKKPYINGSTFTKYNDFTTYYGTSRYRGSSEYMRVVFGYQSAEIEVSPAALKVGMTVTCGLSPDLTSAYVKLNNANQAIAPLNTAISENLNILLPPIGYNRESERNAKLTGYLSGATGILSGAGGLIGGLATGNPGLIAGAAQSAIQGVNTLYKTSILKTLTNMPASRDTFAVEILQKERLYIAVNYPADYADEVILRQYEYTGIDTLYEINEYLEKEKCQAFNFIQCDQSIEIHGIPEEPAQRIAAALIQGVTLWTSSDVGNKKQINY